MNLILALIIIVLSNVFFSIVTYILLRRILKLVIDNILRK